MFIELGEIQKGIYFDCKTGGKSEYNISTAIKTKKLNKDKLQEALYCTVAEQEVLKYCVTLQEDTLVFNICNEDKINFVCIEECTDEMANCFLQEMACEEFDLEKGPLYRVLLLEKSEKEQILAVCMHHIISDGVSINLFINILLYYYGRLDRGEWFRLQRQEGYRKFLEAENQKLKKGVYSKQKEYWKEKLKGTKALELLSDYSVKSTDSGIGREKRFAINRYIYQRMEDICREYEVSAFMLFLSAFAIIMNKYTDSSDITIASSFSYRPGFDFDSSIGCFIYTLPLRFKINRNDRFSDILKQASTNIYESYKNIGYPNNLIVRDSSLLPAVGIKSIFDVTFICDSYDSNADIGIEGIYETDTVTFPGDMMVIMQTFDGETCLKLQYKQEIFSDDTIEYIGQRFLRLLEEISENSSCSISELDLFISGEKDFILNKINNTSYFQYTPQNIAEYFERKVGVCPNKIGIICGAHTYTFSKINGMANQLARKIAALKFEENELVGIQLERSLELIIAVLAVIKAGCGYVPIDHAYPEVRKEYIVQDTKLSILITDHSLPWPQNLLSNVIYVDDVDCFTGDISDLGLKLRPESLAYVEYTSGSTGQPKGVMIENQSVLNTVLDLERRFPLLENDVYLLKTTYTFDIFGTEIYGWIVGKGVLCILEKGGEKNPDILLRTIEEYKVTHINFVPSMLRVFLELFENEEQKKKIDTLKWIFVGGEAVTPDMIQKYFSLGIKANLENVYGPTEATMWATHYPIREVKDCVNVSIGTPLNEYRCYIVDKNDELLPVGIAGELCISGVGLARGYLNRELLTEEKFPQNPFYRPGIDRSWYARMYRTGDLARWMPDGTIEFLGRIDFQVKVGGVRIELGEVETALCRQEDIMQAIAVIKKNNTNDSRICVYYRSENEISADILREFLSNEVPAYMIPAFFIHKKDLPLNSSGKVNRKELIADQSYLKKAGTVFSGPKNEMETLIAEIWKEVLSIEQVAVEDNFFEIGGHSLTLMQVHNKLKYRLKTDFSITELLRLPTIKKLAEFLSGREKKEVIDRKELFRKKAGKSNSDIAIVGIAVDVPGAENVQEFWDILKEGKETIHFYTDDELREIGISESLLNSPNFVKAKGRVEDLEFFDSDFFEISPREVTMTSPQLRLLYKGTWEVLEDAGYNPDEFDGKVGVFLGGSDDFEWYRNSLFENASYSDTYQTYTLSTNHFLATRISYKFNFKGPAISALTGCSTSLVTAHLACQSLLMDECDMAIAGGVTVELPNDGGYMYEEGMMFSPDGHCRPFDADARGTVFSNGMALVALRRLDDALRSGDHIYAVIKGSAVNNDGSNKISYTAPSEDGQIDVIQSAYRNAGLDPETVGFVEAHGTGTLLGDPIEIRSLTKAFASDRKQYCVLGSLKGNIGHTDTAAGIVGLSKTGLCLEHKFIPATVNYNVPNPKVEFADTPFVVKNKGENWIRKKEESHIPLRAGINSFGVGGTNVHFVLEEAPPEEKSSPESDYNLFTFSARTESALNNTIQKVLTYISGHSEINISDAAWTMLSGRKKFEFRKSVVLDSACRDHVEDMIKNAVIKSCTIKNQDRKKVYFLFPGQGSQYQGMGKDLYFGNQELWICREYRKIADSLFAYLPEDEKDEFFDVIYGNYNPEKINQTKYSQFALFITEYAVAMLMLKMGVEPTALLGHSIGEVVAAVVAGVFRLKDAVKAVRARGDFMQEQEPGVMLAVMAEESTVSKYLTDSVWISLCNTSGKCVVGGKKEEIENLCRVLDTEGINNTILKTSHAFHTPMMDQAAERFEALLSQFEFNRPKYPVISNVTGKLALDDELLDPHYWAKHITSRVWFEKDLSIMLEDENCFGIEVGAGKTLSTFAIQHKQKKNGQVFVNLIRHIRETVSDVEYLYEQIGKLWCADVSINVEMLESTNTRRRISLPSYAFDRLSYPIITRQNMKTVENICDADVKDSNADNVNRMNRAHIGQIKDCAAAEEHVIKAYIEVFGFKEIDRDGDFFAMGGDSLKAVSLAAVLRNNMGIKLDVQNIFAHTTPKQLADYIFANNDFTDICSVITQAPKAEFYALSSAQKRMYTFYLMDKEGLAYNLPSATVIEGELQKEQVLQAVKKLVDRHESLRTSFDVVNGEIVSIVHDIVDLPVSFHEGVYQAEDDFEHLVNNFVKPFDLSKAPLFRMELVTIGAGRQLLLFDIHHIIADGSAVEIMTRDFNALYFGELSPIKIQYKDFALWQNEFLNSEKIKQQEAFWKEQLSGELPVLNLPVDFERPTVSDFQGERIEFKLSEELTEKIKEVSGKFRATNFMVMLSAWYILLHRYTGQEDIIIGTPVSGRTQDEIRETVGMFVNMLALRNYPAADKRFCDFILEVKEGTLNALKNQDYQFDTLVERMHVKRELNRNAVFDVSFDYHNMEIYDLEVDGLKFIPREIQNHAVSLDLLLTCSESDSSQLECYIDFSVRLFKRDTIERLAAHYVKILECIVENQEVEIGRMDIITENDKKVILGQFENNRLTIDDNILIQEMFEKNAAVIPESLALIAENGTQFTYRYLNECANSLAWKLMDAGITDGKFAGVLSSRNEKLVIAMLAVLKAGGAYVAMDPQYPASRIEAMVSQCNMDVILCERNYQELVPKDPVIIYFDEWNIDEKQEINPPVCSNRESIAYAIFTSGSTGLPKGVMVKQEGMVNLIFDHIHRKIFTSVNDRIACIASPSFDIFGFETIIPLCSGASIYMAGEEELLDANLLSKKIAEHHITHIQAPVSRLRAMAENSNFKTILPQLKVIVGGGESYPDTLAAYLRQNTSARLFNMYGPTEATITATVKELTDEGKVNIGYPIANTQVFVISENTTIQPVGVFGELCIAGRGISKGYINRPEETKDRFIQIGDESPVKVYRTGDRARLLANGEVELLGRLDTQVKIRGYRVELGEIEKVAMLFEGVSYAVAKVFDSNNSNVRLALFYSRQQHISEMGMEDRLTEWMSSKLPVYMVPSYVKCLKNMPLLPNGKVDRQALTLESDFIELDGNRHNETRYALTIMEGKIQEIWKDILKIDHISLKDNFFDLGGNSYSLMLVNNKLNDLLGYPVSLMQLFKNPTIKTLAEYLNNDQSSVRIEAEDEPAEQAEAESKDTDIAVIGMSGRFPGAFSVDELWKNILDGKESVISFTEEELHKSGISEDEFRDENYVNAKGYLEGVEYFDADFFHYSKKEANTMDPQIRLLHMCVWNALEDAGYDSFSYPGKIGLFAGSGSNISWMTKFFGKRNDSLSAFEAMTMNDKDFLTTKVSYKLNLKGPSVNVQTACSTSLVAVHEAVKCLLCNEAEIVAAGGVSISYPRKEGYMWHEGMIYSKDGHCRPFSNDSSGTVSGNGCGIVILKKLSNAVRDNDHIYAVIKGSAINNDGNGKIGYTAPSIAGEREAVKKALGIAGVSPVDIQYVEAHGTGTELGDPIEIEALTQAWNIAKKECCAIGSIKANIGHLDAAAGIAGFMKAVLVAENRIVPPMINFKGMNPRINIKESPFYINLKPQKIEAPVVHTAVSAFGIGGTNAHIVLEEMQDILQSDRAADINILVFSAQSREALELTSKKVINYLKSTQAVNLSDAAYTLQVGRSCFDYRKAVIVKGKKIEVNGQNAFMYCEPDMKPDTNVRFMLQIPEMTLSAADELINSKCGIGAVFNQYMEEVTNKLKYDERKTIANIIGGKKCENKTEEDMVSFLLLYAVTKTLFHIGLAPDGILGTRTGKLCGYVLAQAVSLDTALTLLREGIKQSFCESDYRNADWCKPQIEVLQEDCREDKDVVILNVGDIGSRVDEESLYIYIGKLWTKGVSICWNALYKNTRRARISLPGYVFDKVLFDSDVVFREYCEDSDDERHNEGGMDLIRNKDAMRDEFAKIWLEVLGIEIQNDADDFFELGGDSLNAVLMVSLIRKRLGINMHVTEVFQNSQYGNMLDWLQEHCEISQTGRKDDEISRLEDRPYYETSSAQKRMYAVNQLLEKDLSYNLGSVYYIEGRLDQERLNEAFVALAKRHESFRTSFGIVDDEIVQYISSEIPSIVEFVHVKQENAEREICNSIRPFDLCTAPLIRVKFISINEEKHYLVIDMHHIISDQSSIAVLLKEFTMLYEGKVLQEKNIRYIDFAAWQNGLLEDGRIKKQLDYWKHEFDDGIPKLDFPADSAVLQTASRKGKIKHFELDAECCGMVNAFIKEQHITAYMLMLASLDVLLWKYTAQKDIVVGTAVAGRKNSELNDMVGMFVNILPIRIMIDEALRVTDYLQYLKKKMADAFDASDCQFEMLLEELKVDMGTSQNPFFNIVINYVNMGTEELKIEGLSLFPCVPDIIDSKYDLTLTIEEHDGRYFIDIEYVTDLFKDITIELFGERFMGLIRGLIENQQETLNQILVATTKDAECLDAWNDTETLAPTERNLISIFEDTVRKYPEHEALIWGEEAFSYRQLHEITDIVAGQLTAEGVGYKDKVAILVERGPLQIAVILAILKCGAVYVPMDCEYPGERINFMIGDSGAKLAVTQEDYAGLIEGAVKTLILGKQMQYLNVCTHQGSCFKGMPKELCGEDEAYIIYTSGSTGRPKGTVICHKSVIRTVIDTNYLDISCTDRMLQMANYTFDASVFDIFGTLLNGACLVMVPREISVEMAELKRILKTQKISKALIITAIFNLLVDYDVNSLKYIDKIYIGGEALSLNHMKRALACVGAGHLINLYGPTEACVCATYYEIDQIDDEWTSVPIGKAISNTTLYIVDDCGNTLPPKVSGELCIGGPGLAKGYLNREEITREKFVQRNRDTRGRIYHTGDKAMMMPDGCILYLGRMDFQIKLRGFRIELGEVEQKIAAIHGIKDVVAIAGKDSTDSLYLGAYYTTFEGMKSHVGPDEIRSILKKQLPEYMIPTRMCRLESLPITVNGKVDRQALAAVPIREEKSVAASGREAGNEAERVILHTIREVLDQPDMRMSDNFFAYGGQSIKAIILTQKLREQGIKLMVNDVFQNQTAEEIAALESVASQFTSKDLLKGEAIEEPEGIISLSAGQIPAIADYICNSAMMMSDVITKNETVNQFDMAAVQRAHMKAEANQGGFTIYVDGINEYDIRQRLAELITAHQLLHCSADFGQLKWVEYNVEEQSYVIGHSIPYCDLTHYDETAKQKILKTAYEKMMLAEYSEKKLFFRVACFRLSQERTQILWCFHHSIFDGMSAEILKRQILLKEDKKTENDRSRTYDYQDYVETLAQGPVNMDEDRIINKFDIRHWCELNVSAIRQIRNQPGKLKEVKIEIPIEDCGDNVWEYTFLYITRILGKYLGLHEVPAAVVNYARSSSGKEFFDCIGEFLDVMPVILDTECGEMEKDIEELLRFCRDYSINFMNLAGITDIKTGYHKLQKYIGDYLDMNAGMDVILLNFQGFISEEEQKLFESAEDGDSQKEALAKMVVTANYNQEFLRIFIECRDGIKKQAVEEILSVENMDGKCSW